MVQRTIKFIGSVFTLSVLYILDCNIEKIKKDLNETISQSPMFFKNIPIVVNVSNLSDQVNWADIKKIILSFRLHIVGVICCKEGRLKNKILESGLPILSIGDSKFKKNIFLQEKKSKIVNVNCIGTHVINTPIRSGQFVYIKNSNVVVMNNVSSGAELVADGNIYIYGILRGRVLAGANGDITCHIFCTKLFSELVSIAGVYWLIDQIPVDYIGKGAQIFFKNNKLNIRKFK
ncbi:septum site-determining protein MinC [Buchnera aphidicola]|uniref:septum site-determining protein MinC n=1 Tax=Buchnera aphidicola TaxID=9 RepID=UPI0031B86173